MSVTIINATFKSGCRRVTITEPLYMYDIGITVHLTGVRNLPEYFTAYFANSETGTATEMLGHDRDVVIPNELLTTGLPVYMWVYVIETETNARTMYKVKIPVKQRARGDSEVTPEQAEAIESAIAALNESEEAIAEASLQMETITGSLPIGRVTSLDETRLTIGSVVEATGIPVYVGDVDLYTDYGLTATGWYVFAEITPPSGTTATGAEVDGAAYYKTDAGVNVAVLFDVAATAKIVTVTWDDGNPETFIFRANDLAVRNLDYRTTFYVYDIDEYAIWTYSLTEDETFSEGKTYYILEDETYTAAEVEAGAEVPADTYYVHSKLTFEGMTRNVTYRFNELVDAPIEIILPEIPDDHYGAWFEIQMQYDATHSCELIMPSDDVKVGTAVTQSQTAGINVIDLHYVNANGAKVWTLINTHSNLPTEGGT